MKNILLLNFAFIVILFFSCKDVIVTSPESNQNVEDFEAAWNKINEVYPYLEFKNINWDAVENLQNILNSDAWKAPHHRERNAVTWPELTYVNSPA